MERRREPDDGPPVAPTGSIELRRPPNLPARSAGTLTNVLPMLGGLGSIAVVASMGSSASGGQTRTFLGAGMFGAATLAFAVLQLDGQRRQHAREVAGGRSAYLRYLGTVRALVRDAAIRQRRALLWQHPHPNALPGVVDEGSRVWARPVTDRHVRYAVAERPLSLELMSPDDGPADHADHVDPAAAVVLHRLVAVHRVQPDLPATLDLHVLDGIEVCGPPAWRRSVARALVCSAAVGQSPAHLTVAVLASADSLAEWDWAKWLPHALSDRLADAVGPRRLVSTSQPELVSLLPPGRRLLLVVDDAELLAGRPRETTVLDLTGRPRDGAADRRVRLVFDDVAGIDQCDLATAEAVARRLTRHRTRLGANAAGSGQRSSPPELTDLLGLGEVQQYDAPTAWRARASRDLLLRVPIGVDDAGAVVELDLKEAAQHGMGPHGLVVGATGSGKSELLRTIVLGLALTHSPEHLNLVLVDFKGGATFAGMSAMPHVSAVITNLAEELALVDRMQDALTGEMVRRQELLRDAGNHASLRDYERARTAGARLDPLPSLVVVVDEFAEMLTAKPEFLDVFTAIGRQGRSLGLHLLLATQRLEEGRLRGLESHLSYRLGLRMFSTQESRVVLGVPDAYELPPDPGLGFLRSGQAAPVRFAAAYVSSPARAPHATTGEPPVILPWTVSEVARATSTQPPDAPAEDSLLDVAVGRLTGQGPPARRVWLPPLDVPDTLDVLMTDLAADTELGLVSRDWRRRGPLAVPLGRVDRPRQQRHDVLTVDLSGAHGNVAVVGGPRSGKSTLLCTLAAGLALTTTPLETQLFVLDFGGGTFAAMRPLPHLAGLASLAEPDVVRRIVAEVTDIVDRREARGAVDADGYGEVFLVVDGWGALRSDFDDLEPELQRLASRGLAFGCHVLTSASRWADYRAGIRDLLGTRLELRLGDPLDSEVDRRLAAQVPASSPGRGLVPGGHHFLAALPRIDGDPRTGSVDEGIESLVERVAGAWRGPVGPRLRLLPERITTDDLLARADEPRRASGVLLLALDERALAPVGLDPDREPHWLVFGDSGSGKSAALRSYVHEVIRTRAPAQAQVAVVDYRRSLLDEVPDEYLAHYLTSSAEAATTLAGLASYLTDNRIPGPDVTPTQLRDRTWWRGAELYVVVDDYDLVATTSGSPLQTLLPLLARARDVGLHLAVARHSGGASRAMFEPVLQTLRDLATPGLVLSGSPEEGVLVGNVRPRPLPPGRGRLVTRDRGVDVVQLAWREPAL